MLKITQVEVQKKNSRRFNIYLDGQFAFGADEDLVVNHRLLVGKEILPEDLPKLLFEGEVGKLMERMYGLFSIRQRSEKEIRDYLKRLSFKRKLKDQEELSELVIESLIERSKLKGLINDTQFAAAWVDGRRKSKKKGIQALKAELYQKGIDREIIEEVLSGNPSTGTQDGSWKPEDEQQLAKEALEKKAKALKNLELREFKKKALEFLVRKGFSYDVAKDVIEIYLKKE